MKKLIYCCIFLFALMACGERSNANILGLWSMEFESGGEPTYSLLMPDDSICTTNLIFKQEKVYMQVKSDDKIVSCEFIGMYAIKDDSLKFTSRYGKQRECKFTVENNIMTVVDKKDPDIIIMRLKKHFQS